MTKKFRLMTLTNDQGFTLIEMMVVLGIIVLISVIAMPTVGSYFQVSLNSATRDMAASIKEAYNSAIVTGRVHRMVYDIKENKFWVESGPADALLHTKESKEKEDRRKKLSKSSDAPPQSEFSLETSVTRKKLSLPQGVQYEDVLTEQSPDPISSGTAYTHFFPNGLTERTIVHLHDQSKHHASLVITALLGMTDVFDRYVNGPEVFPK